MNIANSLHPEYLLYTEEWLKFRYIMDGGDTFIEKYVKQFSSAEDPTDFENRKEITPIAGFAKAAIRDINNAIFQRMGAIRRNGGTDSWRDAVRGRRSGVDLIGSTMNHFIGTEVLPELLAMGKVGIYVDNFSFIEGRSRSEVGQQHPYIYAFRAEDIRNWEYYVKGHEVKLKKLLLRVTEDILDPDYLLVNQYIEIYRLFKEEDGVVLVKTFDDKGNLLDTEPIELKISEIPFVVLELQSSLLKDISNHQIALTNMESADIGYTLRSNVPLYTEQYDARFEASRNWSESDGSENIPEHRIGATDGVRYPTGHDRPGFIHPSAEPLNASMAKQSQLKDDIRTLVNLAVANTRSRFASAESKQMDERGLEAGLSAIGLVLEHAEARVAHLWSEYESSTDEITVSYPERYSLKSDEDRRRDADQLARTAVDVPSRTFRKELQKEIVKTLLAGKIDDATLDKIMIEIDSSEYPTLEPLQIRSDVEIGLISREYASKIRGYPEGEAEKAKEERLETELNRMTAQTKGFENPAARGLTDDDPEAAKKEKQESQNPENNPDNKKLVRGEE